MSLPQRCPVCGGGAQDAPRFFYLTFVLSDGTHAALYARIEAGEVLLMRRAAQTIGKVISEQVGVALVCHVLSALEVSEAVMRADGVEDPLHVSGMPLAAPERPSEADPDL